MAFFQAETLWVQHLSDGVACLVVDVPGRPVNVLSRQVLAELATALERIAAEPAFRVLLLRSGKPGQFLAGADLHELAQVSSPEAAQALAEQGQQLCQRLADLPVPSVALIEGPCLGGGLELALACDYRLVVDQPRTRLGFPEVEHGLIPAWGGTQRLPRLVGLLRGLSLLVSGRRLSAVEACRWGLADTLLPSVPDDLSSHIQEWSKRPLPARRRRWWQRLLEGHALGRRLIFRGVERLLRRRLPDDLPAPWEALRAVQVGLEQGWEAGLAYERQAVGRLASSPACRHLLQLFLRRQAARRLSAEAQATEPPRRIGVVGSGPLGAYIAYLAALRDCQVLLQESHDIALAEGVFRILAFFHQAQQQGRLSPAQLAEKLDAIRGTTTYKGFAELDLVVEAIEEMEEKKKIIRELDRRLPAGCLLASITHTGPVQLLQQGLEQPQRLIGLHLAPLLSRTGLVELIPTSQTAPSGVHRLQRWLIELGQTPLLVGDSPCFLLNRLFIPYIFESLCILGEGLSPEWIDHSLRRFGMAVGPLELLDEVGIEVMAAVAQAAGSWVRAFWPGQPDLAELAARGWSGRKSGRGFYVYRRGRRRRVHGAAVAWWRRRYAPQAPAWPLAPGEQRQLLQERVLGLQINEAARCLEEQVVAEAEQLDLALVLGAGWAPYRGGPLTYAREQGFAKMVEKLEQLAERYGPRFAPAALLRRWAAEQEAVTSRPLAESPEKLFSGGTTQA